MINILWLNLKRHKISLIYGTSESMSTTTAPVLSGYKGYRDEIAFGCLGLLLIAVIIVILVVFSGRKNRRKQQRRSESFDSVFSASPQEHV